MRYIFIIRGFEIGAECKSGTQARFLRRHYRGLSDQKLADMAAETRSLLNRYPHIPTVWAA